MYRNHQTGWLWSRLDHDTWGGIRSELEPCKIKWSEFKWEKDMKVYVTFFSCISTSVLLRLRQQSIDWLRYLCFSLLKSPFLLFFSPSFVCFKYLTHAIECCCTGCYSIVQRFIFIVNLINIINVVMSVEPVCGSVKYVLVLCLNTINNFNLVNLVDATRT